MCGRFVASRPIEDIIDQFEVGDVRVPPELVPGPRFNVAPTDEVLAVRGVSKRPDADDGAEGPGGDVERRLGTYRWGLVPSWAKDPAVGARAFNARAETVTTKPMFRRALARRRCIVPADAYYEWQRLDPATGKPLRPDAQRRSEGSASQQRRPGRSVKRQPWVFRAADGSMLALSGLYEVWRQSPEDEWLVTCTLITTTANELMSPVHDRMPVVLRPEDYETWLNPGELDEAELRSLLAPPPDDFLECYRVGPAVGSSKAEGPQLVEPLENSA
jgi:putative SOS response-associated peptidase YedK